MADAHTRIFHEWLEPALRLVLSSIAWRILLWVARNSYGRNGAKSCSLSWRKMASDLCADRSNVRHAGARLIAMGILVKNGANEIGIDKRRVRSLDLGANHPGVKLPMGSNYHKPWGQTTQGLSI